MYHLCSGCRERLSNGGDSQKDHRGICDICGSLLEHVDDYFEMFRDESKKYEFSTFLIGLRATEENVQRDEQMLEKSGKGTRSYKEEFQFRLGSRIEKELSYVADFARPELTFTIDQQNMDYSVWVRPVFVKGRYLKKRRGIPQSPWIKSGKGKEEEKSVSEYISKPVVDLFDGANYNFFASGREDVDALMLGNGRPFYVEVRAPRKRNVDLSALSGLVLAGSREGVEIIDLSLADPSDIEEMKNLRSDKTYEVGLTVNGIEVSGLGERLRKYSNLRIEQKTPRRVLNVRKDRMRERTIRSIELKSSDGDQIVLLIRAEAGTYIKEFITGDNGRTVPNLKEELDINVKIDYLDVLEVK